METRRFVLIALLGVVLFFAYQAWQKDNNGQSEPETTSQQASAPAAAGSGIPAPQAQPLANGKKRAEGTAQQASKSASANVPASGQPAFGSGTVHVHTDTLDVSIGLTGADLQRVALNKYDYSKNEPKRKLALLTNRFNSKKRPFFVFHTGLAGVNKTLAGNKTPYTTDKKEFDLPSGSDTLSVPLTYADPAAGYKIRVIYKFHRGSYVIGLDREIINTGGKPLRVAPYGRWLRNTVQAGVPQKFVHTYFGMGFYEQEGSKYKFKKHHLTDFKDDPYRREQKGGWAAMLQQYFVAAMIPEPTKKVTYTGNVANLKQGRYYVQMLGQTRTVAPGATKKFDARLYIGPKTQGKLDDVAPGLGLTEDYGIFAPIAKPLFWVLSKLEGLTGNWGWAIVLLTLGIRGAFFKLSEKQYRSMAKMRKFGPQIKALKERFADDREQLNRAMMDLYKKEKFNPLSGCWPLVLQFPVFIALYYVLIESVEMRQAPFILWLQDLSSPDPYYILPILYGITMWFQQRLSGQMATMPAAQQKMMNIMPIGLAAFFSLFPSGLVLYYVVSNAFTIIQQYVITRRLDREGLGHR